MEKQTNNRLIAMVVFLVLALGLVLLWRFVIDKEDETTTLEATATPDPDAATELFPEAIFDVVSSVEIRDLQDSLIFRAELDPATLETGATLDPFAALPTYEWLILESTTDSDLPDIDHDRINTAVAALPGLLPSRKLSDIDSVADFGLGSDARYEISFTTLNSGPYSLTLGSQNVGGSAYYAQVPGDSSIYLVNVYDVSPLIDLLTSPPYTEIELLVLETPTP